MNPIRVTEEMPPQNSTVILYCQDEDCLSPWDDELGIIIGWWSGSRFHGRIGKEHPEKVTHWCKIPPYPDM